MNSRNGKRIVHRWFCLIFVMNLGCSVGMAENTRAARNEEKTKKSSAAITNSTPTAYDAVRLLLNRTGTGSSTIGCSGTLITPRVIMSAAHCFYDGFYEVFAEDVEYWYQDYAVQPGDPKMVSIVFDPQYKPNDPWSFHDIALLYMDRDLTNNAPALPWNGWTPDPTEGLAMVGFSPQGGTKIRGWANTDLVAYDDSGIEAGDDQHAICNGDSGGPLLGFNTGVIGVASFWLGSSSTTCGDAPLSFFSRVDVSMNFIFQVLEAWNSWPTQW